MEGQTESVETPRWLKRLQDNSWEAEILISGGAIFSLVQSSEFITSIGITFKENYPFNGLDPTLAWLTLAISCLTIGFIIHLFLRGYWVALVCLNSAFPKGVKIDKFRVADSYKDKVRSYSLSQHIIKVDQLSGIVFFCSVILSLFAIGTLVHLGVTFILVNVLESIPIIPWIIAGLFVIHYLDFITSGIIFRSKLLGQLYKPFYVTNNYLCLGFLYLAPLQILVTNIGRVKLSLFLLALTILSALVSYESLRNVFRQPDYFAWHAYEGSTNNDLYRENFYLDKVEYRVDWFAIQTDLITDHHLKVFVPYRPAYDKTIAKINAKSFDQVVRIEINKTQVDSLFWYNYDFKKTKQKGIIAYIPIEHLPNGKNEITLLIDNEYITKRFPSVTIPFWKD